jgi:hypothetical protein
MMRIAASAGGGHVCTRLHRLWLQLAGLVLGLAAAATLQAGTSVRVLDTYPEGDRVVLGRNQNFYLRLSYEADGTVGIWARPYFHGQPANAGSNGSYSYRGSGEALGWFFFSANRGEVDEIRISAGDGSTAGTAVVLSYPVHVTASESETDSADQPEWVSRLRAADAVQQRLARQQYANRGASPLAALLGGAFMIAVLALGLGGVGLPVRALLRWRGGWRIAAAGPAALMGFVVLRIIVGVAADPTAHNLWPFEILMAGLASTVVMALLSLARRATGATMG